MQLLLEPRWCLAAIGLGLGFGGLSALVNARRLHFYAGSIPHSALLGVALGYIASSVLGGPILLWAVAVSVAVALVFEELNRRVGAEEAAAAIVALSSTLAVAAIYAMVSLGLAPAADLTAYIVGDPLLVSEAGAVVAVGAGLAALLYSLAVHSIHVCAGFDPEGVRLAGVNLRLHDALLAAALAAYGVAMLRVAGFIMEHVLILLPGAVAYRSARSASEYFVGSVAASYAASTLGLAAGVAIGVAPMVLVGGLLLGLYATAILAGR